MSPQAVTLVAKARLSGHDGRGSAATVNHLGTTLDALQADGSGVQRHVDPEHHRPGRTRLASVSRPIHPDPATRL